VCEKAARKTLAKLTQSIEFTNILRASFAPMINVDLTGAQGRVFGIEIAIVSQ